MSDMLGFPGGPSDKEPETLVGSLGLEDRLEKGMAIHSVFLPGESQGQRSLVGYIVHKVAKSWTQQK